jgi:ABC-2 type transport system ATP-binding protein
MVEITDLWKRYPGTWALNGISLTVPKGRVVGVLGENGSGKSTLFRILAGVTRPTKGTVSIQNQPVGLETRRVTAYLPEVDPYYPWMTVGEQLRFLSAFYPGWDWTKSDELIELMGLDRDKKLGALSKGMRARVKVVAAFSWPSALVLLDEPLGGIDPPSRRRIMEGLFNEYRSGEQTILMSTHLVGEIEEFVEDVAYIREGEIVLQGNADALREEHETSLSGIFDTVAT